MNFLTENPKQTQSAATAFLKGRPLKFWHGISANYGTPTRVSLALVHSMPPWPAISCHTFPIGSHGCSRCSAQLVSTSVRFPQAKRVPIISGSFLCCCRFLMMQQLQGCSELGRFSSVRGQVIVSNRFAEGWDETLYQPGSPWRFLIQGFKARFSSSTCRLFSSQGFS